MTANYSNRIIESLNRLSTINNYYESTNTAQHDSPQDFKLLKAQQIHQHTNNKIRHINNLFPVGWGLTIEPWSKYNTTFKPGFPDLDYYDYFYVCGTINIWI